MKKAHKNGGGKRVWEENRVMFFVFFLGDGGEKMGEVHIIEATKR